MQPSSQVCKDQLSQSRSVVVRRRCLLVVDVDYFLTICTGSLPKVQVYCVRHRAEVDAGISPTGYKRSVRICGLHRWYLRQNIMFEIQDALA